MTPMEPTMTHLSLFSGIGGLDLAAEWAGFKTVQMVEREPYCQKILAKNFPGVPIHDDVTTFDGRPFRGRITCLSGGFPCQDISQAGKQEGLTGKRSGLWFEMLRIIGEVRPAWVVAENVGALVRMGIDTCLAGLEAEGYTTRTVVFPACGVGAVHRRERCFIIARNSDTERLQEFNDGEPEGAEYIDGRPASDSFDRRGSLGRSSREAKGSGIDPRTSADSDCLRRDDGSDHRGERHIQNPEIGSQAKDNPERDGREPRACSDSDACDTGGGGLSGEPRRGAGEEPTHRYTPMAGGDWRAWDVKPVFRKSDDELPAYMVRDRVNILKALGNAVCPNQAYPIFQAITKEVQGQAQKEVSK